MAGQEIYNAVVAFDKNSVVTLVRKELDRGTDVSLILREGLIAALREVGERFNRGEMFLPEMLGAAQAMRAGLEIIRPLLSGGDARAAGTVVIGTVKGDLHDIGKDLVAMMLEGAAFDVINLGANVDPDRFVAAARDAKADVVGLSALLTTTMPAMTATVSSLRRAGIAAKIIVGGAPVNQAFADEIGADGYADDAPGAVAVVRRLVGGRASAFA